MTVKNFSDYNPVDSETANIFWVGFDSDYQGPGLYKATDPIACEYLGDISSYDVVFDSDAAISYGRVNIGFDCYEIIFDSDGYGSVRIFKIDY